MAIGDVHGDLHAFRAALRVANAIDERDHWVGGPLVVVQTGDQLDRGDDERRILEWTDELALSARAAGGALYALNGNHEIMNVAGDFRYVTQRGFSEFSGVSGQALAQLELQRVPELMRGRVAAFRPGGPYARRLGERETVVVVGDTLFAHAGVLPSHVQYGLGRLNAEVRSWMQGKRPTPPSIVQESESPVWTRVYGELAPSETVCTELGTLLRALSVRRMVVGHTVQPSGINAACAGQVYRIDVGLAAYYGDNPIEVLQIEGGKADVLRGTRRSAASASSASRRSREGRSVGGAVMMRSEGAQ